MHRRTLLAVGLAVLGVALLSIPVVLPVEPVLEHDTSSSIRSNNTTVLQEFSYDVVHYDNLSDRGKELYRTTLENGGEHRVPVGEGAPEFQYPTRKELSQYEDEPTKGIRASSVVIVRPEDDSDLPPAGEEPGYERYDTMDTVTVDPDYGSGRYVHHILGLVFGLVSLVTAAYLVVAKPQISALETG